MGALQDALFLVASTTIISPVRHFLEGLAWDGFPRVQNWLSRYCGAERSDLTAKVGTAWLVSAVARVLKPGCKADCALVLEGKQGAGKSSILRALLKAIVALPEYLMFRLLRAYFTLESMLGILIQQDGHNLEAPVRLDIVSANPLRIA
jgi:hypothetical protein